MQNAASPKVIHAIVRNFIPRQIVLKKTEEFKSFFLRSAAFAPLQTWE